MSKSKSALDGFFWLQNARKTVIGFGGAYEAPLDPLVGWGGAPRSHTPPLDAFGASVLTYHF